MIPILYEKNETAFTTNGLGRLSDCVSCIASEERNGVYEVEFQYPVTGVNFENITIGRIIACTHDENGDIQPFDIYKKSEPINGVVTFNARHISYRLNEFTVEPFTASSCAAALTGLKTNSIGTNPFSFDTNKSVSASYNVSVPSSCRGLLGGEQNSILDVFGTGEYQWDKFNVYLWTHRGSDTDVSIRYGKNLVDFNNELDYGDTYNAVAPYWYGQVQNEETAETEDVLVTLPEKYISSGNALPGGRLVIVPLDCSGDFQTQPTEAQLRSLATSRLNAGYAWNPSQNITIDFVQLWQTAEYKDYEPLQKVKLCDTVLIDVPMYGIAGMRIKVIKVVYNTLLDRYDSIELGTPQTTLAEVLSQNLPTAEEIEKLKKIVETNKVITGNTNQHFWFTETGTDTGAHITEIEREEFLDDPYNGGGNLLGRSNGIAIRDGMTELSTFAAGGSRIGRADQNNVQIDPDETGFYKSTTKVGYVKQTAYTPPQTGVEVPNTMIWHAEDMMLLEVGNPDYPQEEIREDTVYFRVGDGIFSLHDYSDGACQLQLEMPNWQKANQNVLITMDTDAIGADFGIMDGNVGIKRGSKWLIRMESDGYARIPEAYDKTTGNAPNMNINQWGSLMRNGSSSKRYKKDIEDIKGADALYDVKVRQFKYREDYLDSEDRRYDKILCGFIVEELEDVYPIAVDYMDEQPEDWNFRFLIPPMLKLIQDQKKEIDNLKERIEALERRL